jgi:hypothetical protein
LCPQWHFSTPLDALDHWQALLAGILGFTAAIIVVVVTLRSERRKAKRDLEALRLSLALEIRQSLTVARGTFRSLTKLAQKEDGPITYRMVESVAQFQKPLIFPSVAANLGLMGPAAMEVLIFYSLVDIVRRATERLATYRTPDNISPIVIAGTANGLVVALQKGTSLITAFKTNEATIDDRDATLAAQIASDTAEWATVRESKWPNLASAPGRPG